MNISISKEGDTFVVKDDQDRILMKNKGDKMAIARFPDLDEKLKNYLAQLYASSTGEDINKAKQFLNYETDTNEFCS